MNKYVIIGIVLVLIMGSGFVFSLTKGGFKCEEGMGQHREFTVVSKKLEWRFEPEEITVDQCDHVEIKVINEDDFDHGFAIEGLGVSQRLPASGSIDIDFIATNSGSFQIFCSVSCSDSASTGNLEDGLVQTGPYKGTKRGHFEHLGQFVVRIFQAMGMMDEHDDHDDHVHDDSHMH